MDRIRCPLDEAAEIFRELPALICSNRRFSYQEYRNLVSATAKKLGDLGFEEGDRVALLFANDWRYVVLIMALLRIRVIVCPLDSRTPPQGLKPLLDKIACHKLIIPSRETTREILTGGNVFDPNELVDVDDVRKKSLTEVEVDTEQSATIIFTSGSLGTPKAVLHSYGNHYYNAKGSNQNIRLGPGDRWLLALPLYHVGGLSILFRCILNGAAVVVPGKDEKFQESLNRYSITHLSLVPTQLYRLLREERTNEVRAELRAVLLGGASVPANLLEEGFARGLPLYTSYGLTEMASQVTATSSDTSREQRFTSGKVLAYRQLCISPAGEILVKGETLFKGYVDREALERPVDSDGWFTTGDLGKLDPDGYLTVRGRKDNMFISGGENIQPEEIEMALCEHAAVMQAVVVPVPDEEFGSRPVAFVQSRSARFHPQELIEFVGEKLARYKIPIAFYDWPETAGLEGMKVSRELFRRLAAQKRESTKSA